MQELQALRRLAACTCPCRHLVQQGPGGADACWQLAGGASAEGGHGRDALRGASPAAAQAHSNAAGRETATATAQQPASVRQRMHGLATG